MKKIILAAAVLALSASAQAQSDTGGPGVRLRPFVGLGLTWGGDKLDSVEFENGDSTTIRAGGLVDVKAGVDVHFDSPFSAQISVGYHFQTIRGETRYGDDGRKTFDRYPVEVLGHWDLNDQWRIGGGLRWSQNAKFSSNGALDVGNVEFESTTGVVVEGEYFVTPAVALKLRAVREKYKLKGYSTAPEYDGSHVGFYVSYYFN
jgi:predicted porin